MSREEQIASLLVELGLDTSGFDKSIAQVNRTTSQLEKGFTQAKKALELSEKGLADYTKAIKAGESVISQYKTKIQALENAFKEQENNIRSLKEEHEKLPASIKKAEEALEKLKQEGKQNTDEFKKQENALQTLKAKYSNFDTSVSNAVNKLRAIENQIQVTNNKMNSAEKDVKKLSDEFKKLGSKTKLDDVAKKMEEVSKKSKDLAEKLDKIKDKADKISKAGGLALGAMSASFYETDSASMKLKGSLGLTEKQTKELTETARNLAKKGFDMTDATQSLTEVKQVMQDSLSPQQVEDLSRQMLALNKVFEVDTKDALKAVSLMVKNFGIDGQKAMDVIVAGFQNGLDVSGDWLDSLWEYSVYFDDLGFTAEDTLAIISKGMEEGTFNTDKMADMLKEGKIRLLEMNKASEEAISSLGLNAKTVQKNIGDGGETAKKQIQELAQKILEIEDPVERNRVAVALFGTQFEDLGTNGLKALSEVDKSLINTKGKAEELSKTVEESFGNKLRGAFEKVKEPLAELGEKFLIPMIETVGELAGKFADWFGKLDEGQKEFVILGTIGVASLSPVIGVASGLVKVFQFVTKAIGFVSRGFGGLSSKFGGLSTLMSNPLALAGAVLGLMASIGESEGAILFMQEKFGGLGIAISGVCEFISGLWDLTIKSMINGFIFLFDVIGAIIDGPGNTTIADAWKRYNANQQLNVEEGMAKLALSTTRGMSTLRHLQDSELNVMVDSLKTTMDNIPLIVDGEYQQASENMATSLSAMNQNQLLALTNMNDTTRVLFDGIREGMTIEEIVPILSENFEQINNSGKFNIEDLKEGVTKAMDTTKSQMDSKSSEGATAVEQNMNDATNAVNTATSEMASEASSGMSRVASGMIDESGKIPPQIQSNMETSAKTIESTLSTMARNIEKSFNDLCYNAEHYLQRIINKASAVGSAFSSCSSQVYSFASNAMRWVDTASSNIISDWNRVINTLNRNITGRVTINKTINESVVSKPQTYGLADMNSDLNSAMQTFDLRSIDYRSSRYKASPIVASRELKKEEINNDMVRELKEQNSILMQMLTVLMSERETTINTSLVCSGREIAKASAKYMKKEIADIDKQTNRKRGII